MIAKPRCKCTPLGANARINNIDVNRPLRKEGRGTPKSVGALTYILRRDSVTDIYDLRVQRNAMDHPLHSTDKAVTDPKIGGESNNGHACSSLARSLCFFRIINGGRMNWGLRSLDQVA